MPRVILGKPGLRTSVKLTPNPINPKFNPKLLEQLEYSCSLTGRNCKKSEGSMLKTGFQKIIVLLWLLSFVGQAVAAVSMPCGMNHTQPVEQQISTPVTGPMDHAMHSEYPKSSIPQNIAAQSQSCGNHCDCTFGNCLTVLLFASQADVQPLATSISPYDALLTKDPLLLSLYRPPIFR